MNKSDIVSGTILIYKKCSCGDVNLTIGKEYSVVNVKYPMITFYDDNGDLRVKSVKSRCFDLKK